VREEAGPWLKAGVTGAVSSLWGVVRGRRRAGCRGWRAGAVRLRGVGVAAERGPRPSQL